MRAIRARAPSACAYDLEVVWGESVLLREHVSPPVPFLLTTSQAAQRAEIRSFVVGEELLDTSERELVCVQDDALWLVSEGGRERIEAGVSRTLALGDLEVRITGSEPVQLASLRTSPVALRSHAWTLVSFAVHLLALACMALLPPRASSLSLDLASQDSRTLKYLSMAIERVEAPVALGTAAASSGGGAPAPSHSAQPARASRSQGPRRARAAQPLRAGEAGILGVLHMSTMLLPEGPTSDGLDYDPVAALRALAGDLPGAGEQIGALALRGPGRGGAPGELGTIAVGGLDTGTLARAASAMTLTSPQHRARVPRAGIAGDATVRGSLSKEVIRRTIQRHLSEVRFCYESALRTRPELGGRVNVTFLIAPSGAVQATGLADSSLGHAGTEQCIVQAVRRWTFPAPEGGGFVQVSYPFLLAVR